MNERPRMALASNMGFARCYCNGCESETLHRSQLCIHCGTLAGIHQRVESKSPQQRFKEGLQIKRRRA